MNPSPCPSCGADLLEGAAFCARCGKPVGGPGATAPLERDTAVDLGQALGPGYEVRGLIGQGGFALVYEVWDKPLSRRLAAKVLRPDVAWTQGMLDRFKEECRVLAGLNHPNILPIHFVGAGEGLTYYVMPFVAGETLGQYLRTAGALEVSRALEIAVPVLEALGHAHQAGLLHRDIKPDNVLLDGGSGRPMLVDFGIAKRLNGDTHLTQTGFVIGTPQYMSPEQALGQGGVDARSDLYAFGAMLFQMVTGAPPYDGDSSQEIVGKHIAEPVPAPVDRNARIPAWLSTVIVRCLAKRPGDRFQSAPQLVDALKLGRASGKSDTVTAAQVADRVSRQDIEAPGPQSSTGATVVTAASRARPKRLGWVVLAGGLLALAWWFLLRPVTVRIDNRFDRTLELTLPSGETVRIPGGGAQILGLAGPGFHRLLWKAEPVEGDGGPMGDTADGELALDLGRGLTTRSVGLTDARIAMFSPLVTNESSVPLEIIVNYGLAGARRCACLVPPGAVRQPVGDYPLYRNSTVRAVAPDGRTATFVDLGDQVNTRLAKVGLRFGDADLR
ncbi:MAG: serine/threonine-protein kinase [Gemmatimonadales bacterium]